MAKQNGWWKLTTNVDCNEADLKHIAECIEDEYTSGELIKNETEEKDFKTFTIPCTWMVVGDYKVEAYSLEEAENEIQTRIQNNDFELPESNEYVEESLEICCSEVLEQANEED